MGPSDVDTDVVGLARLDHEIRSEVCPLVVKDETLPFPLSLSRSITHVAMPVSKPQTFLE